MNQMLRPLDSPQPNWWANNSPQVLFCLGLSNMLYIVSKYKKSVVLRNRWKRVLATLGYP